MYRVLHHGRIVKVFGSFLDAWLYVYLELDSFAQVYGPDPFDPALNGEWSVNPGPHHIN